jgi:uncharacterized protein with HEPN domain
MTPAVRIRLQDMLEYARGAVDLLQRHHRGGVLAEWGLQQGLIKAIEVVGETAWKIPTTERPPLGDLPWEQVAGMRHHLVHGYGAVRIEVLFKVVEENLPPLIAQLEHILRDETQ